LTQPADLSARTRIRESLDESLLVEAAAGTGKTSELVARAVAALRSGRASVDRLAAVTFTRKAAGELKLRLRFELDAARRAAGEPDEQARLQDAIERLEEARIGTIHSFCAELLRERPVEAGIDPAFRELDEEDAAALFRQAFDRWLQDRLAAGSPVLRRALARPPARADRSATEGLRLAAWCLAERRDHPAPWHRRPFDRDAEADAMAVRVAELAALLVQGPPGDALRVALAPVADRALALGRAERAAGRRDHDALEASLVELSRLLARWTHQRKGSGRRFGPLERSAVVAARDALAAELVQFRTRAEADLAAALRHELGGAVERYEALKAREGRLDFLDLVLRARDLLRDDRTAREHFQERFTHLFVDELQDTDPLQLEVLLLLAADDPGERDWRRARPVPGKLFLVGDPKQSIYRFRRADVALYQELRDGLAARGVGVVGLTTSFRSLRPLQQLVNAAFEPEMTGDRETAQPAYLPLDEWRRQPEGLEQPCVVALPAPRPFKSRVANEAIEASLPGAVAGFVHWLLRDSGWTVADPEQAGAPVPVRPGHVALLFRQFASFGGDLTRPYVEALEARAVPHVLLGSRSFHQREEVETLRAALEAIEHPDDELSVFATLKGSLFAVPDEPLLRWRLEVGPLHPFLTADEPPPELAPVATALALLGHLHRGRNRVPLPETLHRLLGATRAHAGFALRPAGEQVLANVSHVADLARSFELKGGISFRGFVERLAEEAESVAARQAPVIEETAEGVRLMTVHAAKGLEFPVVVLADLTSPLAPREPGEHADSGRGLWAGKLLGCAPWELIEQSERENRLAAAEGVRLAYVAATRARDLLVVPVVGVERREGWLRPLSKALYPPAERWHQAEPAPGCPPFGPFTVLALPEGYHGEPPPQVRPGWHAPEVGEHRVAWFDPARLDLDAKGSFGLRQEEILREDGGEVAAAQGLLRARAWERRRADALAAGARPSRRLATVSEIARAPAPPVVTGARLLPAPALPPARPPGPELEPLVESVTREPGRPGGPRFGTLVHAVLRDVPLDADAGAVAAVAAVQARLLQASDEERETATGAVLAALAHPLLRRAAAADALRREVPFALSLEGGPGEPPALVEGVVDLAFREGTLWTVVDFKTDEDGAVREQYRRQLGWYAAALRAAGGEVGGAALLLL
jgi:ATP-dependent exoDNAse (exonuclease V) beta subunit